MIDCFSAYIQGSMVSDLYHYDWCIGQARLNINFRQVYLLLDEMVDDDVAVSIRFTVKKELFYVYNVDKRVHQSIGIVIMF